MHTIDKIKHSWWVILSLIPGINGFGFIYLGSKYNNQNWIIEGIIYEIPWFFSLVYGMIFTGNIAVSQSISTLASLLYFVCLIRSIWVLTKLWNVYDNYEQYAQNPTQLNNSNKVNPNTGGSSTSSCCLCIVFVFIIFALIGIIL